MDVWSCALIGRISSLSWTWLDWFLLYNWRSEKIVGPDWKVWHYWKHGHDGSFCISSEAVVGYSGLVCLGSVGVYLQRSRNRCPSIVLGIFVVSHQVKELKWLPRLHLGTWRTKVETAALMKSWMELCIGVMNVWRFLNGFDSWPSSLVWQRLKTVLTCWNKKNANSKCSSSCRFLKQKYRRLEHWSGGCIVICVFWSTRYPNWDD